MDVNVLAGISEAAKAKIEELKIRVEQETRKKPIMPAILWVDGNMNEGRVQSQPGIGFYDDQAELDEIRDHIATVSGLEVVIGFSAPDIDRFKGKILDYDGTYFFFR